MKRKPVDMLKRSQEQAAYLMTLRRKRNFEGFVAFALVVAYGIGRQHERDGVPERKR